MNSFSISPSLTIGIAEDSFNTDNSAEIGWSVNVFYDSYLGSFFSISTSLGYTNYRFKFNNDFYNYNFIDVNAKLRFHIPLSLLRGELYLTPFLAFGTGIDVDFSDINILVPLIFSVGVEMAVGKYKETFFWGAEFSYIQYFSPFGELTTTLSMLKPLIYVKWFF